jgi:hypothetical protein
MEAALVARHASDDEARAMLESNQNPKLDQKNQGAAPCKSTPAFAE